MSQDGLEPQIALFEQLLPALRREFGDVWAVVSSSRLEGKFGTFRDAAQHVLTHLAGEKVLIRHTNAPQPHVPFVAVDS
ncbi:MAG: hypothetical protein INR64_05325 [Caulobacteraceae bacterium]|nr:hypothetical protein [Caulobacter sp.]